MAVSITPKGNRLLSGKLSVYEEQLFYKRINAGPKTMAKASVRQLRKKGVVAFADKYSPKIN